jgi:hypothetical protein
VAAGFEYLSKNTWGKRTAWALFILSIGFQFLLEKKQVNQWNHGVDEYPAKVWDWRGPQWSYPLRESLWFPLEFQLKDEKTEALQYTLKVELRHQDILWSWVYSDNRGRGRLYSPMPDNLEIRLVHPGTDQQLKSIRISNSHAVKRVEVFLASRP